MTTRRLAALLREVRSCDFCAARLPLGPRPVVRMKPTARLLVVGQAPGTRVHETGIPWNDRSGDVLRDWLAMDRDSFYDESRIAIMPMGFCYPGRDPRGGDNPPRPECAPRWHDRLLQHLPELRLTLLVGQYAQAHYLGPQRRESLTETVRHYRDYLPRFLPLPHPSWRNLAWRRRHPWFDADVVPELRRLVEAALR
ncbi:MAG TPA: uracil-DNA glycosylase family protein [Ferrovibrio sp.]|uniref:uracil-DNA glycosylase family protein n=1 Tax=Ferrovibrio sp. TaxID=1917215 RepID=UPI002B4B0488|nr:uracil-DNA glycosylase family protein [Ferrovibrio sp.]HLT77665.1 uracil-DNA glycosylase family protein [Ferrovibrio sp.]